MFCDRIISQQGAHPVSQKWVGLHRNQEAEFPEWVVSASYFKEFIFGLVQSNVEFMGDFCKSIVGSQYFTLSEIKLNARDAEPFTTFSSWMSRGRVDRLSCGNAHTISI